MSPLVKKKSILKNSTSTPVAYSDGTFLATSSAAHANAQWNFTPAASAGASMSSFDKIMLNAAQYRSSKNVNTPTDPTINPDFDSETVPTVPPERPSKVMEVADVASDADLDKLKNKDAFMYYSLPGARNAALTAQKFNVTGLKRNATIGAGLKCQVKAENQVSNARNPRFDLRITKGSTTDSAEMRRASSDSILQVKRKTRISCEEHFGVLLEGIMELDLSSRRPSACLDGEDSVDGMFMPPGVSVSSTHFDDEKDDDDENLFYESVARIHGKRVLPENVDM